METKARFEFGMILTMSFFHSYVFSDTIQFGDFIYSTSSKNYLTTISTIAGCL